MINYGTGQDWSWLPGLKEVRFTIHIDDRPITCRVWHDWLSREYGEPEEGKDWFNVAQEHFDDITDAIHQKILGDDIEPDGSILLK